MLHESKMSIFLFLVSLLISVSANALSIEQLSDNELQDLERGIQAMEQKEYELARQKLMPLAERGYPYAEYTIGWMYLNGAGTAANRCKGVLWIDQAARHDFLGAQLAMSEVLQNFTLGIRPDYQRSYGWLLTAINNGATNPRQGVLGHKDIVQPLIAHLSAKLSKEEMLEVKQQVVEGRFDVKTPALNYVTYLREIHIDNTVIQLPPCEE